MAETLESLICLKCGSDLWEIYEDMFKCGKCGLKVETLTDSMPNLKAILENLR